MEEYADILKQGGVGVIPTDTIYGLVASAHNKVAIERLYTIKGRDIDKPYIILIRGIGDLEAFGAHISPDAHRLIDTYWPGPLTIIVPVREERYQYLHRGKQSLAFRMPKDTLVQEMLEETGPLVAPSANPQGEKPADTIEDAKKYFGDAVDFYLDDGKREGCASTIVDCTEEKCTVIRKGDITIEI